MRISLIIMVRNLNIVPLIIILFGFTACTEKGLPSTSIQGIWNLIETKGMMETDYSSNRIFYEFDPDGTLTVQNGNGAMNGIFEGGEYKYEVLEGGPEKWNEYTYYGTVKIEDEIYGFYLAPNKLVLVDNPAFDGTLTFFIR
ncbi:hypothetical protein FKX85_15870 [Echinicola soli]|uniref:Lipocalin-like domain-containing protein n=1 Tax=Echinicola soli TaxID=2591634 RepID=A0A514CL00_9BACT|nr:hypothetical protein [Echinicola soli]QDH80437.1 hypothetical protein FKX85_15870 [Echinicola soli]